MISQLVFLSSKTYVEERTRLERAEAIIQCGSSFAACFVHGDASQASQSFQKHPDYHTIHTVNGWILRTLTPYWKTLYPLHWPCCPCWRPTRSIQSSPTHPWMAMPQLCPRSFSFSDVGLPGETKLSYEYILSSRTLLFLHVQLGTACMCSALCRVQTCLPWKLEDVRSCHTRESGRRDEYQLAVIMLPGTDGMEPIDDAKGLLVEVCSPQCCHSMPGVPSLFRSERETTHAIPRAL